MSICEVCGRSVESDDVELYRQNETGVDGIWRCQDHNAKPVDAGVSDVIQAVRDEARNARRST